MHSTVKNLCCLFLAEVTQGNALPSCFSTDTVNRCLFCSLFDAMFSTFCAFRWWFCGLKWSPRIVLKCCHEKAVNMPSGRNTCYISFLQACVIVLLAVSSVFINQQYILNKVPLNRNTSNRVLYWLVHKKNVTRGLQEPNIVFSSKNSGSVFANLVFAASL